MVPTVALPLSEAAVDELVSTPLEGLQVRADEVRRLAHGNRITFSPKVFIPLTMLCRDRCGYCTFAKAPARLESPYLSLDQVLDIARAGRAAGCHEALFTLGEGPEDRYPDARQWLDDHGYGSTVDYLVAACRAVLEETGLLPHANAGALSLEEMTALRAVTASQGMMIESVNPDLAAHRSAPDKDPARRLATLDAAGQAGIPFTTGLLVGIGESRADRLATLEAIAASHARHGHVQEVIVQNFLPKPGTSMHRSPPCPTDEFLWTIAVARLVLPADIHLQAPPNLSDELAPLMASGIDDWGGVSPVTADHVNPERAWPALGILRGATEAAGFTLAPRLTLYPTFALDPDRWLDDAMRFPVLDASDAEGLGRDHPWCSGGEIAPPALLGGAPPAGSPTPPPMATVATTSGAVGDVLAGVLAGETVGEDEIVTLFSARGREVRAVAEVADQLREEAVGDEVTYVANRNINYTNVCTFKCKFCAFSKGPLSLNLRGKPYLLDLSEISDRVREAESLGATEVCLQGGIHPNFDGEYYLDVIKAVREASATIHIHGFTALEVTEGARRSGMPLADYLVLLRDAGLKTIPGTAAEILDDPVRAILCPDKISTDEWLFAHRTAHGVGLRSNVTIMFGAVEQPRSWARHLVVTRDLRARDRRLHRVRAPALRPHGNAYLSAAQVAAGAHLPRDAADARRRADRLPGGDRQHPDQLGEDGCRRRPPDPAGRRERSGRHPDGREHLTGGRCQSRPDDGCRAILRHRHAAGPDPGPAHHPLRPGDGSGPRERSAGRRQLMTSGSGGARPRPGSTDGPAGGATTSDTVAAAVDRLAETLSTSESSAAQRRLYRSMLETVAGLAAEGTEVIDLKVADSALAEMAEAFRVFRPYRHERKVTIFGSARTEPDHPAYRCTRDLAASMAGADWMVVTGAGPGIMAAGMEGAGREKSIGVNIRLPFEQGANTFIAQDPKLVEMRYFFTRKLMLIKESDAYVVLPGGFGTLDEGYELLTLLQTGKAEPAPVVMLDVPDGTYWSGWDEFLRTKVEPRGLVSPDDRSLFMITNDVVEATEEILGFYRNYQSCRWVGDLLVMRMLRAPSPSLLAELNGSFGDIVASGSMRLSKPLPPERSDGEHLDLARLVFRFDKTHYGRLRQLIDTLNAIPV